MWNTRGSRGARWIAVTLALTGLGGLPERAGAAEQKSVAEELLDVLKEAGTLDEQQYQDLRVRARKEQQERIDAAVAAATLPAVAAADPGQEWSFKWSNGFKLERGDGAFKLLFGGRIQNDWALIDLDEELEDRVGGEGNGTEFRRARLFFSGTVYERLFFKAQYDFAADGNSEFRDVYLGLKKLGPIDAIQVGHMKEPFSLEEQTSSKYGTFLERSLPNVFSPGRNTGLMIQGTELDDRLLWAAGLFKNTNDSGFNFDDNSSWNATLRLAGVPLYEDEGSRVIHLGLGYSHQFRGSGFFQRYRQRPEVHLANRWVDTGAIIPARDIDLINPELAVVWGPASLQAEWVQAFVKNDDRHNNDFYGAYVEASYFLTGEHRNYELGKGRFGRIKPLENFDPAKGHWGAWQLATRFSYLDLYDGFAQGGTLWTITAAVNWYLYPNARVMLNYVHGNLRDRTVLPTGGAPLFDDVNGEGDMVQVRFQIDF